MPDDSASISRNLQSAYNEQYSGASTEWRTLGAKAKAANIRQMCKGRNFERVLECGAGEGSILQALDEMKLFPQLSALEISDSGIAQIERRAITSLREVRKFDGYSIPHPDAAFDMVYCSHVLEHVEHPRLLLRELRRVARFQVFEVPLDYSIGVHKQAAALLDYGHINVFTPSLFKFLLLSEGFTILKERVSQPTPEFTRFDWYRNQNVRQTWWTELRIKLQPWVEKWRQLRMGKHAYREFAHRAYTCLCDGSGQLRVLGH